MALPPECIPSDSHGQHLRHLMQRQVDQRHAHAGLVRAPNGPPRTMSHVSRMNPVLEPHSIIGRHEWHTKLNREGEPYEVCNKAGMREGPQDRLSL